jgi:hypothetical protein
MISTVSIIIRLLENPGGNQQLDEVLVLLCKKIQLLVYSVLSFLGFLALASTRAFSS